MCVSITFGHRFCSNVKVKVTTKLSTARNPSSRHMPLVLGHRDVSTPKPPLDATQDRRLVMRPGCFCHHLATCQPIPTFPMPPSQQTNVSCPFGPMGNQILRWKGWGRLEVQSRSCLVARHADIESGSQATAIGVALGSKTKVVFVCLCANFNTEEYSHLQSAAYHLINPFVCPLQWAEEASPEGMRRGPIAKGFGTKASDVPQADSSPEREPNQHQKRSWCESFSKHAGNFTSFL